MKIIPALLAIFLLFFSSSSTDAAMSSVNYRIWADGISSGGNRSTSASYITEDTVGEAATGEDLSSASYLASAGLPAIFEEPIMLFSISDNAVTFSPTIRPSGVSTAAYDLTVSTNARFGYTIQATEDGDFRSNGNTVTDVADGTVTAGALEYGLAVGGADAAFADDEAIPNPAGTPLTIASNASWISDSSVTVTHKASVSNGFPAGNYAHVVTYVAIGNF